MVAVTGPVEFSDVLRGSLSFIDDLEAPGMLYGLAVRSPCARGRITSIVLPEAPPGVSIVRAKDIPGRNILRAWRSSIPILADEEVSYVGQPVLLLCGPNPSVLSEMRDGITISCEESPPWFTLIDHSDEQVFLTRDVIRGNPEDAMRDAYQVIEGEYRTGAQEHFASDTQGALAIPGKGSMLIYSSTQWPYHVRQTVAEVLGMVRKTVRVRVPNIGMHLDGKIWYPSLIAAQAALMARKTGRPVKYLLSRREDFLFTTKRAPVYIRHRTGLDPEGNPLVMDIRIYLDVGAAGLLSQEIIDRMCLCATGAYGCPNIRIGARAILTSKPPLGALSGLGAAQAFFAMEIHASRIAEIAQVDPSEWKRRNLVKKGDMRPSGASRRDIGSSQAVLERVVRRADFFRKHAAYELLKKRRRTVAEGYDPLRGIGLSLCYQGSGFIDGGDDRQDCSVRVRLDKDGTVSIFTSAVPTHPNTVDAWKQLSGKILGVEPGVIRVEDVDTDLVPDSGPSTLSRNITLVRSLIERCCNAIQKKRFRSPLPIEVKRSYRMPKVQEWNEAELSGEPFAAYSWAATVVEVEVHPVTWEITVRGIWMVIDGGRIAHPEQARATLENGVLQALGWASWERIIYRHGEIPEDVYYSYVPTGIDRLPHLAIDFVQHEARTASRGIGELPHSAIPAAFTAAVSQATGTYFDRIPLSPQAIHAGREPS